MFSQASVILFMGDGGVADTPLGRHPPWADTPCQVQAGIHIPAQSMLGYPPPPAATAVDGTHPTGMHSC